jgi:predicted XRE-type DNA-binding protein
LQKLSVTIEKDRIEMKTNASKRPLARVTEGTGNVFADLGLPNAEQEQLKAQLALQIYRIIKQRGLTQTQAAKLLGLKQPHVSLLMRNRTGTFSVGRLIDFLTALGQDVEITVRPTRKKHGELSVALG